MTTIAGDYNDRRWLIIFSQQLYLCCLTIRNPWKINTLSTLFQIWSAISKNMHSYMIQIGGPLTKYRGEPMLQIWAIYFKTMKTLWHFFHYSKNAWASPTKSNCRIAYSYYFDHVWKIMFRDRESLCRSLVIFLHAAKYVPHLSL